MNTSSHPPDRHAQLPIKVLAHLGDAVWELWVREKALHHTFPALTDPTQPLAATDRQASTLHTLTTRWVATSPQAALFHRLPELFPLTEAETALTRRALNTRLGSHRSRGLSQADSRAATAFEALLGYWHLSAPHRLTAFTTALSQWPLFPYGPAPETPPTA